MKEAFYVSVLRVRVVGMARYTRGARHIFPREGGVDGEVKKK